MKCCVLGCKSDSRYSPKWQGITFFKLPSESSLRTAWFQVLGIEEQWKPEEKPVVCSEHFMYEDLYESRSGVVTLRANAVPLIVQDSSNNECENGLSLMVCRICLVMDTKLFSMREYKLEEAYEQLTGVSPFAENRLPHELCAECAQRLINSSRFRHKSLRANSLMVDLLNKHNELSKSNIHSINREDNQLISNLTTVTIIDYYDLYIEEVDEDVEREAEEVKPEDIPDLHLTIKEIDEDAKEIIDDILLNKYDESDVKDDDFSSDNSLHIEETKKKSEECMQYEKVKENNEDEEQRNKEIFLNKYDESDIEDDDSSIDNNSLEETKQNMQKKKLQTDKQVEIKVDGHKKTLSYEYLKKFTVTKLTLKEQMADIEKRKESSNYKNSPYKCIKCYKGFLKADTYNTHMIKHTKACGEYSCGICKIHYKRKYLMIHHCVMHHEQKFNCNICPFVASHRQSAKLHWEWHNGRIYKCHQCDEVFRKDTSFKSHVRIKHPSDFVCDLCGYSFISADGVRLHKKLKHRFNSEPIPDDGPYCETCNIRFIDEQALNRHLYLSTKHPNSDGTRRNDRSRRESITKQREKIVLNKVEGPINCEQCGVQMKNSRAYSIHFKQMHPEKNRTKYPSLKSPIMCEVCGKIFACYAQLEDHKRSHKGERPYECDICGKTFLLKYGIFNHIQTHMAGKNVPECELCGKKFKWQRNKTRHMLIHSGVKPYKCEFCGKAFKLPSETRNHIKYKHHKVPWPKRNRGKRRKDENVTLASEQPAADTTDMEV